MTYEIRGIGYTCPEFKLTPVHLKEIITIYCKNYMLGVKENSNIHLQFYMYLILELIVGEERRLENVETPLASVSHTEYLMSTKLRNVNTSEAIICLLLLYTPCIITLHTLYHYVTLYRGLLVRQYYIYITSV